MNISRKTKTIYMHNIKDTVDLVMFLEGED